MKAMSLLLCACVMTTVFEARAQSNLPHSNPNSPYYNSVYLPSQGLGDTRPNRNDKWGAFAGSKPDGASGIGLDRSDQSSAEMAAMDHCKRSGGTNCELFFVFLNQCAAVASTESEHGWARGRSLRQVKSQAMRSCDSPRCEIIFEHCL